MTQPPLLRFRPFNRLRVALGAMLVVTCLLAIWVLAVDLRRQIDVQRSSKMDNVQWTLAQVHVELTRLALSTEEARHYNGALTDLRLRYDVIYSRLTTLKDGDVFQTLRGVQTFTDNLALLDRFVVDYLDLMDGPDADLRASLPRLADDAMALDATARTMILEGVKHYSIVSDMDRRAVERTLNITAGLTALLIAALIGLIFVMLRLDRTNRGHALRNLQTLSRLDTIVATAQEAIVTVDDQGRIVDFNGAAAQTFGYSRAEAIGRDLAELIAGTEQTVFQPGKAPVIWGPGQVQIMTRHKTGRLFPVELSMSQSQTETAALYVAFMRDLSVQMAAEYALTAARDEALAGEKAKADLLVVMSHEIRTPLNGMIGTIELLSGTDVAPHQKEYLRILEASGRLLMHHVNDVLDIARLDSGKANLSAAPFDLQAMVQEVLENQTPAARGNADVLRYQGPTDGRTTVVVDGALLRQVLLNLVGNAVKFTRNGQITVQVQHLSPAGPTVISVSDTGIGIAKADLTRVFDDFVTLDASYARRASGTGLGLGIVKRIVVRLGGRLEVDSQLGQGSVFRVTLPLPILDQVPTLAIKPAPTDAARPMATLVVEDNDFNRLIIRDMLRREGHQVVEARDGDEGIALAVKRRFDLILMDISMPRVDGLQATRAIRQDHSASRHTPIVAMTAHALPEEAARFRAAGLRDTLIKPITRRALQAVLSPVIQSEPAPVLIDLAVLHSMAGDLGPDRTERLMDRFLTETSQSVARLSDTTRTLDQSAIREIHRLEGSAAMFGAQAMRLALSQMQTAWTQGAADQVSRDLTGLPALWQQTQQAYVDAEALPQLSSLR